MIAVVILAAGRSRRLGFCKALAPFVPAPPVLHLLRASSPHSDTPPVVVSGAHHDSIAEYLRSTPGVPQYELVYNSRFAEGRTGSLACGLRERPGCDVLIAPVDVPLVPELVFRTLVAKWRQAGAPARGWLAPSYCAPSGRDLRFGHPILVGRDLAQRVRSAAPDSELRSMRSVASPLLSVDVDAPEILDDLDTEADFAAIAGRISRR